MTHHNCLRNTSFPSDSGQMMMTQNMRICIASIVILTLAPRQALRLIMTLQACHDIRKATWPKAPTDLTVASITQSLPMSGSVDVRTTVVMVPENINRSSKVAELLMLRNISIIHRGVEVAEGP